MYQYAWCRKDVQMGGSRGRDRGSGPLLENHKLWVSIGNKQSDPPPPALEKLDPHLEIVGPPLAHWKMIVFFEINHWTSVN